MILEQIELGGRELSVETGAIARQANKRTYALMAVLAAAKVRNLWLRLQELLD